MEQQPENLVSFGRGLNLKRAEETFLTLHTLPEGSPCRLDLSSCAHVDVGAGWRLGLALRAFAAKGRLSITVPDITTFDDRQWFLHFTRSGLGMAMAKYAAEISTPSRDITEELRAYYRHPRSSIETSLPAWIGSTFLMVQDLHQGVLPVEDEGRFKSILTDLLPRAQVDVEAYTGSSLDSLMRLLFEAVQNVWDHADQSPIRPGSEIVSYIAARYYQTINLPKALTNEFSCYLQRWSTKIPDGTDYRGFIEIVVADDGVGVAARHAQDLGIYQGPVAEEVIALTEAMANGNSVKLRVHDATIRGVPGFGSAKIAAGLTDLAAFAVLRTGRTLAFFDSTSTESMFSCRTEPLGLMPGTVLQVVFPRRIARVWDERR